MAAITLERVSRTFDTGHAAVVDVDLTIGDGELVVLVGPSGSGKSTLLRLIAGLEHPTSGRILIDGHDVTSVPPQQRDLAMVFQSYALYPHMTVRENLAFGLKMRGHPRAGIDDRVREAASMLQITELLDRRPAQLSGGQRQRVALGRAIVRQPKAFLLDEPLSNLDPALRLDTRTELAALHRRLRATMVYVTHDQEEAMKLGERVVLLNAGRIEQAAPPMEVYRRPATLFAATFLGSPPMNQVAGVVRGANVEVPALGLTLPLPGPSRPDDEKVVVGVRPEDVAIVNTSEADAVLEVSAVEPTGSHLHVHLMGGDPIVKLVAILSGETAVALGDRLPVHFRRSRLHVFSRT